MVRCLLILTFIISLLIPSSGSEPLDRIVAVVGDSVILNSELEAYIALKNSQTSDSTATTSRAAQRAESLQELIDGKVLIVHAEKDTTISISNQEIETELNNRVNYILSQNRLSLAEFETILKNEQGLSLIKFKKKIRGQIRQELIKQKVQQQYVVSAKTNRADIEKFYTQYKDSLPRLGESLLLSVLTVSPAVSTRAREDAFSKINTIKQLLDKGEPFEAVAKKYSQDPNASQGGDLGFISKGDLSELSFEEKVFSLKVGQISEPFETRLGFHVVEILEKKENKVHVRQIFISITPTTGETEKLQATLDSIRTNCADKSCFSAAVQQFSTDLVSKSRGGRLRWQMVSQLDPAIKSGFTSLKPGEISSVIRDQKNLSLYYIDSVAQSRGYTLENDWNEISQIAQQVLLQKKLVELIAKWRNDIYIEKKL